MMNSMINENGVTFKELEKNIYACSAFSVCFFRRVQFSNSSLSSASIRGKNFSRQPVSVLMAQEYTFLKDTRFSSLLFPSIS